MEIIRRGLFLERISRVCVSIVKNLITLKIHAGIGKLADWKPRNQTKKAAYSVEKAMVADPKPFIAEQLEVLKKLMKSSVEESNSTGSSGLIARKGAVLLLSCKTV